MKRFKKKNLRLVLFFLTLTGFMVLHFYIPRFITEIKNPIILTVKGNYKLKSNDSFTDENTKGKFINFNSFDGVELSSFLTYSETDSVKGTIILLHGIRSHKEHFIGLSQKLAVQGYNSVALDSRAHGASKAVHCTFGVKEKKDISQLINVLNNQENINKNIGVWGQSLGGAIGLQAMATDKRIKFGIIESTFTDFKTITNDYFSYHFGFNIEVLTNYLVHRSGKIAGFDAKDARPLKYAEKISQPVLLVHGRKDKRIKFSYAEQNFAALGSDKKELIEIKSANHLNIWEKGGDEYFEGVLGFIENSIKNE